MSKIGIYGSKEHCLDIAKTLQNFLDMQKKGQSKLPFLNFSMNEMSITLSFTSSMSIDLSDIS